MVVDLYITAFGPLVGDPVRIYQEIPGSGQLFVEEVSQADLINNQPYQIIVDDDATVIWLDADGDDCDPVAFEIKNKPEELTTEESTTEDSTTETTSEEPNEAYLLTCDNFYISYDYRHPGAQNCWEIGLQSLPVVNYDRYFTIYFEAEKSQYETMNATVTINLPANQSGVMDDSNVTGLDWQNNNIDENWIVTKSQITNITPDNGEIIYQDIICTND